MKKKGQKLNHQSGWEDVLKKLDQVIELIKVMRKEKQRYMKVYKQKRWSFWKNHHPRA